MVAPPLKMTCRAFQMHPYHPYIHARRVVVLIQQWVVDPHPNNDWMYPPHPSSPPPRRRTGGCGLLLCCRQACLCSGPSCSGWPAILVFLARGTAYNSLEDGHIDRGGGGYIHGAGEALGVPLRSYLSVVAVGLCGAPGLRSLEAGGCGERMRWRIGDYTLLTTTARCECPKCT